LWIEGFLKVGVKFLTQNTRKSRGYLKHLRIREYAIGFSILTHNKCDSSRSCYVGKTDGAVFCHYLQKFEDQLRGLFLQKFPDSVSSFVIIHVLLVHREMCAEGKPMRKECGLCQSPSTVSICGVCLDDLNFLKAPSIPAPEATDEEVRAWAKENKVSIFVCGRKE
jgi:hypothetical protein